MNLNSGWRYIIIDRATKILLYYSCNGDANAIFYIYCNALSFTIRDGLRLSKIMWPLYVYISISLIYTHTISELEMTVVDTRANYGNFQSTEGSRLRIVDTVLLLYYIIFFSNLSKPYAIPFVFGINHRGSIIIIIIIIDLRDWSFRLRLTKSSWIWLEELFRCQTYYYNTVVSYNINITTVTKYIVVIHYKIK